jgi:dTDP-4-dehydrorhamnose reductase
VDVNSETILLTGALGMLGQDLAAELKSTGARFISADMRDDPGKQITTLDITDSAAVEKIVAQVSPSWIINCAAYTDVDKAEANYQTAFLVNTVGTANLALAARVNNCRLLHVSTDYVYGGGIVQKDSQQRTPYREDSPLAPCGIYGLSKRFGDEFALHILPQACLIVRTSWLYGQHGPNFVHTMLRLGHEKTEIKVVNDQIGSPTWSRWLAQVLVQLVERKAQGIFHASSHGNISWFDFAREIFTQAGMTTKVDPQSTAELNRPAPRPPYSTLDVAKLEGFLGIRCPDWKESLRGHLREIDALKED